MNQYSTENIQVLKGLEGVRKRPSMYIGSTGVDGLHHLVYEIVDNSIDEALAGFCDSITVILEKDLVVQVEDNGRGIPVEMHAEEQKSGLELVMTKLHAGGKFDKQTYKISGGLHGVGVSVVNALSEWCEAVVHRNGMVHRQRYVKGIVETPLQQDGTTERTGTTIRFCPDRSIFSVHEFHFETLSTRLRELAFLNQGISVTIIDRQHEEEQSTTYKFEGGIQEFVTTLNARKTALHPNALSISREIDGVVVDVAMGYNHSYTEAIYSYVNSVHTREGGTHLTGFKVALTKVMNDALQNSKFARKLEDGFEGEDVREGLTAILSLKVPHPQFEGQTKTKLGNPEIRNIVDVIVREEFGLILASDTHLREIIIKKCLAAATARLAARRARDIVRRKNVLDGSGLPGLLADCSEKNTNRTEIYIVEGNSAGGSAKQGRDRRFQAILPIWGKMLNVEKTHVERVLTNDKLNPIIVALGAGIGVDFDISKLRYNKVIIMADADVDGSHIRTLLLTFFFRYMRELVENNHVFIAMPPLFRIAHDKKQVYVHNDAERDKMLEDIKTNSKKGNVSVQRYKGIGEMNADQLWETTMNPESRSIIQIKMDDAMKADEMFSMLMGEEVQPRRKFIEENALYVKNLDI